MKYPTANSRGEKVLRTFFKHGPMTIYQSTEIHGDFASLRAPAGMSHDQLVELYAELVERGCLIRDGIKYKLSTRAWDRTRLLEEGVPVLEVAQPRARNIFTEPMLNFFRRSPWLVAL